MYIYMYIYIYIQCLRPTAGIALRWSTKAVHALTAGRAGMTGDRRPCGRDG